jgi:hypothetical protein
MTAFVVGAEVVEEDAEQDASTRDATNKQDSATQINPLFIWSPFLLYF